MPGQATIGVNLQFSADTSAAQRNIQSLQQTLSQLTKPGPNTLTTELNQGFLKAINSANELKTILNSSVNNMTGKLDLKAFSRGLQASGKTLADYKTQLYALGDGGKQAFNQIAGAVVESEVPLTKTNKLASGLWDTLKRTAKWQLSSSIIHGFMGSLQKAYGYAQDLNRSLNDIRIVTGYGVDKMASFAKEANNAAKALSTTTTAYTEASLIYFQQGLNDADVKARTDVTIKMANVTQQSAETVSQQMTAVWNNFAKGSENLEIYADKMVALGASTASSSEEIAQGLEKFAAVADTVGLSFDYAASALATITATTRQSADTVGTALKTLFSRLESLKLGETLDDDTDLTKYSAALKAVGVDIKDASGELKSMDTILDETMAKWKSLNKDQQVALANTVAGQRQYTQFIALMDNADFFKKNLATEANAEGTLQEQADIYAESWEAAQKRVQAALQDIYTKFIDDGSFINILNGAEKAIEVVSKLIDVLGGLKGTLGLIGTIVTQLFSKEIAAGVNNFADRIRDISGITAANATDLKINAFSLMDNNTSGGSSDLMQQEYVKFQSYIIQNQNKLTDLDLKRIALQGDLNKTIIEQGKYLDDIIAQENEFIDKIEISEDEYRDLLGLAESFKDRIINTGDAINADNIAATYGIGTGVSGQAIDLKAETGQWVNTAESVISDNLIPAEFSNFRDQLTAAIEEYKTNIKGASDVTDELLNSTKTKIIDIFNSMGKKVAIIPEAEHKADMKKLRDISEAIGRVKAVQKATANMELVDIKNLDKSKQSLKELIQQMDHLSADSKKEMLDLIDDTEITDVEQYKAKLDELLKQLLAIQSQTANRVQNGQGYSPQEVNDYTDAHTRLGEAQQNGAISADLQRQSNERLKEQLGQVKVTIGDVVASLSTYMMQIPMLTGQIETMFASWGDGKVTLTDFTSVLMTASSLMRIYATITQIAEKAKKLQNAEESKGIFLARVKSIEEGKEIALLGGLITLTEAKTAADTKNTLAIHLNKQALMNHPIGLILVALTSVIAIITAVTTAISENTKHLRENADAAAETAQKSKEEVASLQSEKAEFDTLLSQYKKGADVKKELIEVSTKLAESLGIQNAAQYIENGQFEELNKKIEEQINLKRKLAGIDARESFESEYKAAGKELQTGIGYRTDKNDQGETGKNRFYSAYKVGAMSSSGISQAQYHDRTIGADNKYLHYGDGAAYLENLDTLDPEAISGAIEEISAAIEAEKKLGDDASQGFIEQWQEQRKKLVEFNNSLTKEMTEAGTILDGLEASGELDIDLDEIKPSNYDNKLQDIVDIIMEQGIDGMTEEMAQQVAAKYINGKNSRAGATADLVDALAEKTGKAKDDIQKWIEGLSEDELSFALTMDPSNIPKEWDQFVAQWNASRDKVLELKVKTNFDTARNAETELSKIEAGKTYEAGDIDEIISTLDAAGIRADEFFTKMADGTYLAKASMIELDSVLETTKINNYTDSIDNLSKQYQENVEKQQLLKEQMNQGPISEERIAEMSQLQQESEELANTMTELGYQLANSAENFDELDLYLQQGLISIEAYSDAYDKLRNQFLAKSVDQGELTTYTKYLLELDNELAENEQQFKGNTAAAEAFARSVLRMNKGVEALAKGIKDWADVLNNSTEGSKEWLDAITDTKAAVADLLDVLPNDLPTDFITDNLALIKEAATGSETAIDSLQAKLAELGAAQLATKLFDGFVDDANNASDSLDFLYSKYDGLKALMDDPLAVNLEDEAFIASLNNMLASGQLTREQLDSILGTMNLEAQYATETETSDEVIQKPKVTQRWIPKEVSKTETINVAKGDSIETVSVPTVRYDWDLVSEATMEPVTDETEHTAWAMTTSMGGKSGGTPKITGISKKATGKSNNYSSSNKGGGSPGGSKGGSGGGGGGSTKKPKLKKVKDEQDRYHEINEKLEDYKHKLSEVGTLKDRAYGGRHLGYLEEELELLNAQNKALDEKISQNKEYLALDKGAIAGYGAKFDEEGRITNYNDVIRSAVEKYNSGAIDDDQYSAIKEALDKYEESLNLAEDLTEEKAENMRKILDAKLEKVEYTVEIKLDATEFNNKILDWELGRLDDREFKSAERVALWAQKGDNAQTNYDTYRSGIVETLKAVGATDKQINNYLNGDVEAIAKLETLTTQAIEDIKSGTESMIDSYETLNEVKKSIEEELVVAWEEHNEKLDEAYEQYDRLEKKINFFKDIVDILGMKRLGMTAAAMERLNASSINLTQNRIQALRSSYEENEKLLAEYQAKRDAASADEAREYWDKRIKEITDKQNELSKNIMDNAKSLLEQIQSNFEDTVKNIFAEFEEEMSGVYGSLEGLQEAFDQRKTVKEEYLPEYEKLYELNKMQRNLNQEMSKINSPKSQERLRDLQEEINELQENGVQMSKYDLEYLQKKYDLRLAEIALEDAQNNKNTVRLTRDSSGNYNYVYTANEETTTQASQKYEDAMYQAQKISEDYLLETSENYLKILQEFNKALEEIATNTELNQEQKIQKMNELSDYYTERLNYFTNENKKAINNNASLYHDEYLSFKAAHDDIQTRAEDTITTTWQETLLAGVLQGYNSLDEYNTEYLTKLGHPDKDESTVLGKVSKRIDDTEILINQILQTIANTDMANFATDVGKQLDIVDSDVETTTKAIEELNRRGGIALGALATTVSTTQSTMNSKLWAMVKDITAVSEAYGKLIERITDIEIKYNVPRIDLSDSTQVAGEGAESSGAGSSGASRTRTSSSGRIHGGSSGKFDTGGYTGAWGTEGRLAMLHEKELVLNKQDTSNMLATVDIVRQLSNLVDLQKFSARQIAQNINAKNALSNYSNAQSNVEQQIHIDASFPGVTAREEIEQAFNELANQALGYIHKY